MLLLFVGTHFAHHLVANLVNPLLPFIREEFSLTNTQVGWLTSAFTLTYGLAQFPGGWLADRLGSRFVIMMAVSGLALTGVFIGIAPSYYLIVLSLILMGILGGGYHPAAAPLVSATVEPWNMGTALGIHQIGGSASPMVAPLIAAAIAGVSGWRASFLWLSAPTLIFGLFAYFVMGKSQGPAVMTKKGKGVSRESSAPKSSISSISAFIALSVVGQGVIHGAMTFVPLFIVSRYGKSKEIAAVWLSISRVGGIFAGPIGGYLSDRIGKIRVVLAISIVAGPVIYLMSRVPYGVPLAAMLIMADMTQFIRMPVSESYIISQVPEKNRSSVLGIYYLASRGAPGLAAPMVGALLDRYSYPVSFGIAGGVLLVASLLSSLFLLRKGTVIA